MDEFVEKWTLNTSELKKDLRKKYKQLRASQSGEARLDAESKISDQLLNLVESYQFDTVASYRAFDSEVSLEKFHMHCQADLCFPRVSGENLEFYKVESDEEFVSSQWGVEEPPARLSHQVSMQDIDAIIVPGLVFDRHCQRMGYGMGFYDRALSAWPGLRIGAAFQLQVSEEALVTESHDMPMNFLVTENYIFRPVVH